MAKSKDDITYGTSQARVSEDEAVRVAYKHGTPLEGGKIAESEPVDVFSSAHNISKSNQATDSETDQCQQQLNYNPADHSQEGGSTDFTTGAPRLPKKGPSTTAHKY